jgi:hypothetical protein
MMLRRAVLQVVLAIVLSMFAFIGFPLTHH